MDKDVIIVDQNFQDAATEIREYGNYLCTVIRQFTDIIQFIREKAVLDEKISENLYSIWQQIGQLDPIIEKQTHTVAKELVEFIDQIDRADRFLY